MPFLPHRRISDMMLRRSGDARTTHISTRDVPGYRLVPKVAPHHPVQQPKASVATEQAASGWPTTLLEIQIGVDKVDIHVSPGQRHASKPPSSRWLRWLRWCSCVSPLARMLIISRMQMHKCSSNNPRATPNCITYHCISPPQHPAHATGVGCILAFCGGFDWLTEACAGILTAVSAVSPL
jgi:hypothetical protein